MLETLCDILWQHAEIEFSSSLKNAYTNRSRYLRLDSALHLNLIDRINCKIRGREMCNGLMLQILQHYGKSYKLFINTSMN